MKKNANLLNLGDKNNYDLRLGTKICKKKIEEQIWMLEGYFLQTLKSMCEKENE